MMNKNFYYFSTHKPEIILDSNFAKQIIEDVKIALPLSKFLEKGVNG